MLLPTVSVIIVVHHYGIILFKIKENLMLTSKIRNNSLSTSVLQYSKYMDHLGGRCIMVNVQPLNFGGSWYLGPAIAPHALQLHVFIIVVTYLN